MSNENIRSEICTAVEVKQGSFNCNNKMIKSYKFVHCVAILLRGDKSTMLIHNQPLRTIFPTKLEIQQGIGQFVSGKCILGKFHQSRGTIHFLTEVELPVPNDKTPNSNDAIPYVYLPYDAFDIHYDHEENILQIVSAQETLILSL